MKLVTVGQFQRICVIALLLSPVSYSVALAHPFHVSFAEAEWNTESKVLEVALKVNPNDLESALRQQAKRRIKLEAAAAEKWIVRYLRGAFIVRTAKKKSVPFRWIGCEISVKDAWLYFEFPLPDGLKNVTITNSILADVRDQKNTVLIKEKKRQATLVFTQHKTEFPIAFDSGDKSKLPDK